jgi:hypothetical protein
MHPVAMWRRTGLKKQTNQETCNYCPNLASSHPVMFDAVPEGFDNAEAYHVVAMRHSQPCHLIYTTSTEEPQTAVALQIQEQRCANRLLAPGAISIGGRLTFSSPASCH